MIGGLSAGPYNLGMKIRNGVLFLLSFGILQGVTRGPAQPIRNHIPAYGMSFVDRSWHSSSTAVPGQILILWRPDVSRTQQLERIQAWGHEVYHGRFAPLSVLQLDASKAPDVVIEALRSDPAVRAVDPNYLRHLLWTPNDPAFPLQWHLQEGYLGMPTAWDYVPTGGDSTIRVGILDSGVAFEDYLIPDYEQSEVAAGSLMAYLRAPDLAQTHFWGGYDAVHQDFHPNDQNGHGTHIAGVIAQSTDNGLDAAGIAFGISLVPIQVANYQGVLQDAWIVDGLYYADSVGVQVVNMSFGGPEPSSVLQTAIQDLASHDILLVAATGNTGDSTLLYPAAFPEVIAVGATNPTDHRAVYSNYGVGIDLVAPGGEGSQGILQESFSRFYMSDSVLARVDSFALVGLIGTSVAAPQVSAALALLLSMGADPQEAKALILYTAKDLGTPGYDLEYGYGRLDIRNAVETLSAGGLPVLDTLRYTWNPPYFYFTGNDQLVYEATRYTPEQPCSLTTLWVNFVNYDTLQTRTKVCTLLVWTDQAGEPGEPLAAIPMEITLPPDTQTWISVDLRSYQLYADGPFWVGHVEPDTGAPTSVVDSLLSGTHRYRPIGTTTWIQETQYDYLQEVEVSYFSYVDTLPPSFDVWMLRNPYLDRLVDFWVISSEMLKNAAPPESCWIALPDSSQEPILFQNMDRQTYKADYSIPDTGTYVLWIKGRDYKDNWGDTNFVFTAASFGPSGGWVQAPDHRLRIEAPAGALEQEVTITTYVEIVEGTQRVYHNGPEGKTTALPLTYRVQMDAPGRVFYKQGNEWVEVFPTYQGSWAEFELSGIYPIQVSGESLRPVLLNRQILIRPMARLQLYIPANWLTPMVEIYALTGQRVAKIPLPEPSPSGLTSFSVPSLVSGLYFLSIRSQGHPPISLGKVIVIR